MGFLDATIRGWKGKSDTPEFKSRVEKARQDWVRQKSRPLAAMAESGSLTPSEAADQLLALDRLSHKMVKQALRRRQQAAPLEGGGIGRLPRKADESQ